MSKKTDRALCAKLDAIYARLPSIACRGQCALACGPIVLTVGEAERLRRTAHQAPRTVNVTCTYLTAAGRCRVYAVRPLICRAYGLVKRMSCPFGCVPDRWLSDHEFVELAAESEAIAGELGITTQDGVRMTGQSFIELQAHVHAPGAIPPELADHDADLTRGLRALHHGQVIGVSSRAVNEARWVKVDPARPKPEEH